MPKIYQQLIDKAVIFGAITLEQYLQIPWDEHDSLQEERPELDKHRGYKQILGNLLILICTLGTGQLINKACTGNFLFFKTTDSSKQIDKINDAIKKMEFALIT